MIAYAINSLLWGFAGIVLGVAAAGGLANTRSPIMGRDRIFGIVLVIATVLSMVAVAVQTYRLGSAIECQADYNRAFAVAIDSRNAAARRERENERNLWLAFLANAPKRPGEQPTPEARDASIRALNTYLDGLDKGNKERQDSPLPTHKCL